MRKSAREKILRYVANLKSAPSLWLLNDKYVTEKIQNLTHISPQTKFAPSFVCSIELTEAEPAGDTDEFAQFVKVSSNITRFPEFNKLLLFRISQYFRRI